VRPREGFLGYVRVVRSWQHGNKELKGIMETNIRKGHQITLGVETLAFGGRGVARVDNYVIFVDGGLPGQEVRARITKKKKGFAEARVLEVVKQSPEIVEARCPHFGVCGGCRFQNLDYEAQKKYKQSQVVESLERLGGFTNPSVEPVMASPDRFYYRNKMEFSFGRQRWLTKDEMAATELTKPKDFALGLHIRGRFDKILDLDTCYLQSEQSVEIFNFVRDFALQSGIAAYTTRDHSGFWRHLVLRDGKNTGDVMVNVVTSEMKDKYDVVDQLAEQLTARFPFITTVVHNINRRKAQVATGDEERVLFGPGTIREKIGHCEFEISANSFFQTNTKGAEMLYQMVERLADFAGDEIVYDLYAGAGTISLFIAQKVQRVVGFELIAAAIKDAQANRLLNGIENCSFVSGDLKDSLQAHAADSQTDGTPDVVIIDPPRAGMHQDVLQQVLKLQPRRIVYVSCNPTTFARDAHLLCAQDYALESVQPVDMFPMTPHIELVSLLTRQ